MWLCVVVCYTRVWYSSMYNLAVNAIDFCLYLLLLQYGKTSLICASKEGHLEVVKYLVEQKANKEAKDEVRNHVVRWVYMNIASVGSNY